MLRCRSHDVAELYFWTGAGVLGFRAGCSSLVAGCIAAITVLTKAFGRVSIAAQGLSVLGVREDWGVQKKEP